jgi:hypothetical protein
VSVRCIKSKIQSVFVWLASTMGFIFSKPDNKKTDNKPKKAADSHIDAHDKAVYELKVQRDRLNKYIANVITPFALSWRCLNVWVE